jgi:signal transduction histidine kinase
VAPAHAGATARAPGAREGRIGPGTVTLLFTMSPVTPLVDPVVAPAAVGRAVLLGRTVATVTAAAAGLLLVDDSRPLVAVLAIVVLTTVAGLVTVSRNPRVVRHPVPILVLDCLVVLGVLAVSRGGVAYFCCAAGACALAGVLVGMRALAVAAVHAALGYVVAASVLHSASASPELAAFVLTFPMAGVLAAIGAAVTTAALDRYVRLSVAVVASAQRSAAASERARLARELHDSVAKTLRGVSLAALALPSSLRRHPALAEQLAGTVSHGATVAAREARELLDGLRLDLPDRDFATTLGGICEQWSRTFGIPVQLVAATVDPPVAVRYEMCRILQEALGNAARHAHASRVAVHLSQTRRYLRLRIRDDGRGFAVPADLSELRAGNHYGIIGMHERAHTVDGTLHVASTPGGGTTVEVSVPLPVRTGTPS